MPTNLENSAVATGLEKISFHSNPKERQCQKMQKKKKKGKNYCTISLISHVSKVMPKILQPRLQQYVNHEILVVQAGFRKGRGTEIKLPPSAGSLKMQESFWKISTSFLLTTPKPLTVCITTNCGKFSRDGNTRPPDLPPEKSVCRARNNS